MCGGGRRNPTDGPRPRRCQGLEVLPRNGSTYKGKPSRRWTSTGCSRAIRNRAGRRLAHTNPRVAATQALPRRRRAASQGIDVNTRSIIQHIESPQRLVRQTHVRWRKPSGLGVRSRRRDRADRPHADDLIQRLKEGKVYVPKQAEAPSRIISRRAI